MKRLAAMLGALVVLLCGSAMAIEAQSAGAEQNIHVIGSGMIMANSGAAAMDVGSFSQATAGNNLFATGGYIDFSQYAGTEQKGGNQQYTDISNTAVALATCGISGSQDGSIEQTGAKDSYASGDNLAVLSAMGPVISRQNLAANGYGWNSAETHLENNLIAESYCSDVNARQGISLVVDPVTIYATERNYMEVYAGDDVNVEQSIFANEGATESIFNNAENSMNAMAGDNLKASQNGVVLQRVWGDNTPGVAINNIGNNLYGLAGNALITYQNAQGSTTTGNIANVIVETDNDATVAFGSHGYIGQFDGAIHYIV